MWTDKPAQASRSPSEGHKPYHENTKPGLVLTKAIQAYKSRPSTWCRLSRAHAENREQVSQGWHPTTCPQTRSNPGIATAPPHSPPVRTSRPHQEKALARMFGCSQTLSRSGEGNSGSPGWVASPWSGAGPYLLCPVASPSSRTVAGYFASFVVTVEREPLPPNGNPVDVDLGLASLAITRDGVKIAPSGFLRTAFQWIGSRT